MVLGYPVRVNRGLTGELMALGLAATLRRFHRITAVAFALGALPALALTPWSASGQPRTHKQTEKTTQTAKAQPAKAAPKQRKQKNAEPARAAAQARGDGFMIDGRWVRVDIIKGDTSLLGYAGKAPAVLILHGSHGLGDGSLFYPQAKALADRGISAFVVHYFDGLSEARKASPALHDQREKVIASAISYVSKLGYVDSDKIGVFGLSLGGFHALSLGSRDARVQAVVNMFGAMPAEVQRKGIDRMPPTLVLHGDRDRIVPVRKAHELESLLKDVGADYEMKIYNGEGHAFKGAAKDDSIARTTDFFERHLGTDRGLLDKPIELDLALAPMVPEKDTLPIRAFTIADELGNVQASPAAAAAATPAADADLTPEEAKAEAGMIDLPPMEEGTPIN